MRTNWNPDLARRVQRADPAARLIVEAVAVEAESIADRPDEWTALDSGAGLEVLSTGGVRLAPQEDFALEQTVSDSWVTLPGSLEDSPVMESAALTWQSDASDQVIRSVTLRLDPQLDPGSPKLVSRWALDLYRVARFSGTAADVEVQPIAQTAYAEAVGASPGDVTFAFSGEPRVGPPPEKEGQSTAILPVVPEPGSGGDVLGGNAGSTLFPYSITIIALRALTSEGFPAGNAGWAVDSTRNRVVADGVTLERWLLDAGQAAVPGRWRRTLQAAVPHLQIRSVHYLAAMASFTGVRAFNLGVLPAQEVELVGQGETPAGTALTYEVKDDGGVWVEFRDGDLAATDNTPQGGTDLRTVTRRPTYEMRVGLAPSPSGIATPIARLLGVREVSRTLLDGEASVGSRDGDSVVSGFDPRTHVGEIQEAVVQVLRTGERDYRDVATMLLSRYPIARLSLRLWYGHPTLARSRWMLVESWLVEDFRADSSAITITCLSPLTYARGEIPAYDAALGRRDALDYANVPIPEAFDDVLTSQAALPERYRGSGIPASVTATVSKRIEKSDAKTELDALARLAGGVMVCSQGRVRFVDILSGGSPVAVFRAEEITIEGVSPGYRTRLPEFFVRWGWQGEEERYAGEVRGFHLTSLEALGDATLDAPPSLDDTVARWIDEEPLASVIAQRTVETGGMGYILLALRCIYPHPHLEQGDEVAVELRDFVAHDPILNRELRGVLWAKGVITSADVAGREFAVWVRRYADISGGVESVGRGSFGSPAVLSIEPTVEVAGELRCTVRGNASTASLRVVARTDRPPTDAETRAGILMEGREAATPAPPDSPLATLAPGDSAWIGALAYSDAGGLGRESHFGIPVRVVRGTDYPAPWFERLVQEEGTHPYTTDISFTIADLSGEAGTLSLWIDPTAATSVDPTGPATGTFAVGATPADIGPDTFFVTGSGPVKLLKDVGVNAQDTVYAWIRFVNDRGGSTELLAVELRRYIVGLEPDGGLQTAHLTAGALPSGLTGPAGLPIGVIEWGANAGGSAETTVAGLHAGGAINRVDFTLRNLRDVTAGVDVSGADARLGKQLSTAGSGVQLGDSRNMPPYTTGGTRGVVVNTSAILTAEDTGSAVEISIAAWSIQYEWGIVSYNSGVIPMGAAYGVTFYVYTDDVDGGAATYVAATLPSTLAAHRNRIFVGQVTAPAAGGSSTSGVNGGGGTALAVVV